MLSNQVIDHLLLINEISVENYSQYTIPELIYVDHEHKFGLVSIIGYGRFSIYSLQDQMSFDLRVVTFYHPHKKKYYSYCIEFDIELTSTSQIVYSVEKLIGSVFEFLIQSYKTPALVHVLQIIKERCVLSELESMYDFIINNKLDKHFIQIKNISHSQDRIEFLISDKNNFILEFYQYNIIKAQKKS